MSGPGLELRIDRRFGTSWVESYELINTGARPVSVGSIAVSTPWRDVYFSAADSLRGAVHAHLWTGGRDSWVWAIPMSGVGPGLGLVLTAGTLDAYSVASRNIVTSSNIRGHLYLHPTDHARNPGAMGGQRPILLPPGASYRWAWRLDWYEDLSTFARRRSELLPSLDHRRPARCGGGGVDHDRTLRWCRLRSWRADHAGGRGGGRRLGDPCVVTDLG